MPFRAAAIFAVLVATTAHAEGVVLESWEHGSWRVELTSNPAFETRTCRVWTGGDGLGTVMLAVGEGGSDASFSYEPVWYRGMPRPFEDDETVELIFDGQNSGIGEALEVSEWVDEWDTQRMDASTSNYRVAETVAMARRSNTLIVGVAGHGQMRVNDTFLLNGFTATWLKASEWCRFDAGKQFQSS